MDKKKAIALTVFLFTLIFILIFYIFSELYTETDIEENITDAIKFKEEYESLNNTLNYKNVSIDENNPFIYKEIKDIIKEINNKESFIVYFGYADSEDSRETIDSFIKVANSHSIKKVYYVNIKDEKADYSLDDAHKVIESKKGSEDYNKLIDKISYILDDYKPLEYINKKDKIEKVEVDKKTIEAPTFIIFKNGTAIAKTDGIFNTDVIEITTEGLKLKEEEIFTEFISKYEENKNTCNIENKAC